ncbi:MAG: hypothetical protein BMS9Abin23_0165 [Thermodesulfobacteriota bacterium]|nr:MAG: hypothetical protein BMS9Abin23_0165 [Thermodesulfobacteriota bacterium]
MGKSRAKFTATVIITAVVVILIVYGFERAERYSSSTEFCIRCHSMTYPYEGLKKSVHRGPLGINPGCGDCHLPPQFTKRVWRHLRGVRELINEWRYDFSTKEAFDARKPAMTAKARASFRAWDSSPCRSCHETPRPVSGFGKSAHATMKERGLTCVDCHRGLFHDPAGS